MAEQPFKLSKDSFYLWKMEPVGQEVFRAIREARQRWVDFLVMGHTVGDVAETAKAVGIIQGLEEVLNFEVED